MKNKEEGQPKVSIIIRTKNEETWISRCLEAVYAQEYDNIEVVLVDNNSSDRTLARARKFPVTITSIKNFLPGKAINIGIENSTGEIIVCLSGHCVPADKNWLKTLIEPLSDKSIAGVYGRQIPSKRTSDVDSRDLYLVFGMEKKIQRVDSFFHNANSAFRKETWIRHRFSETATNIEDRIWGEEIIKSNLLLCYEPEAAVIHWHGIHHNLNSDRARNIAKITAGLDVAKHDRSWLSSITEKPKVICLIPVRGSSIEAESLNLLQTTINTAKRLTFLSDIFVASDCEYNSDIAIRSGIDFALRPSSLSEQGRSMADVLKWFVDYLDEKDLLCDYILLMEQDYPFRDISHLEEMYCLCADEEFETVAPVAEDKRVSYQTVPNEARDSFMFMPKRERDSVLELDLPGYGLITTPSRIRKNQVYLEPVAKSMVKSNLCSVAVRNDRDLRRVLRFVREFPD